MALASAVISVSFLTALIARRQWIALGLELLEIDFSWPTLS
jgi:hypothetical protein